MTPLAPEQEKAIRERLEQHYRPMLDDLVQARDAGWPDGTESAADAAIPFIASASTDVAALLQEVDRLRLENQRLTTLNERANVEFCRSDTQAIAALKDVLAKQQRIEQLEGALSEVLGGFCERGHPGRPCIRTGWVPEERLAVWRQALLGRVGGREGEG